MRTALLKDRQNESRNKVDIGSEIAEDIYFDADEKTATLSFKPNKEYPFEKFIQDVYFKKEELETFLTIVALFNRFTLEGERKSKAQALDDKSISEMMKSLGFSLSVAKGSKEKDANINQEYRVKCSTTNNVADFKVLGVNFYTGTRDRISIVIQDQTSEAGNAYLIVKGSDRSMSGIMDLKEKEKNLYRELMASYKNVGLKQVVYGIGTITRDQV